MLVLFCTSKISRQQEYLRDGFFMWVNCEGLVYNKDCYARSLLWSFIEFGHVVSEENLKQLMTKGYTEGCKNIEQILMITIAYPEYLTL